jgi:hypothetical protein
LVGGLAKPGRGLHVVLWHAMANFVHHAESVLCADVVPVG